MHNHNKENQRHKTNLQSQECQDTAKDEANNSTWADHNSDAPK